MGMKFGRSSKVIVNGPRSPQLALGEAAAEDGMEELCECELAPVEKLDDPVVCSVAYGVRLVMLNEVKLAAEAIDEAEVCDVC